MLLPANTAAPERCLHLLRLLPVDYWDRPVRHHEGQLAHSVACILSMLSLTLPTVLPTGQEHGQVLHYSEYGVGGGTSMDGTHPATSAAQVGRKDTPQPPATCLVMAQQAAAKDNDFTCVYHHRAGGSVPLLWYLSQEL